MKYLKIPLFTAFCVLINGCSAVISYDPTHERFAHSGNFEWLSKNEDTPILLKTDDCCISEKIFFRQVQGRWPHYGGTNRVLLEKGNARVVLVVFDNKKGFLPAHYVIFNFNANAELDLQLQGDLSVGYKFTDKLRGVEFDGVVYSPENLADAYAEHNFELTSIDRNHLKLSGQDTIFDMDTVPKVIFGIHTVSRYTQSGKVIVIFDLDDSGKPINIRQQGAEGRLAQMSKFSLSMMRFQRTNINGGFVERKNQKYIFIYNYSVVH